MNKNNFIPNQKIFLSLFPVFYISGPLLTEIFLLYFVSINFINFELFKKKILKDNRLIQFFFLLIFIQGLLSFPDLNYKNLLYARFYLYYVSILILFDKCEELEDNYDLFIKTITYVLSLLVIFHIFQITTGFDTIDQRLTIPIRQEEIAVSIYSKFYPFILIFLLFVSENFKHEKFILNLRILIITIAIVVPIIVLFSGERMNTIMLFGLILFLLFKYKFLNSLYIILILMITSFLLNNFNYFEGIDRFDYVFRRYFIFFDEISNNFFTDSVWGHHYLAAFDIFKENYIFGIGIKMFSTECLNYLSEFPKACSTHPHNMYLEIASETGVLGILAFIFIVSYVLQIFLKNLMNKKFNIKQVIIFSLSACILIYIFPLRSTGSFFNNYNSSFFWIYLGLILSIYEKKKT